ncbi:MULTISPECIES: hypothetical protein [unclassified Lactobacillus]|uniref:hypothetical protein n=1 Tax=unclassified Lactobacillus TaxID=2620435 RepID=UPI000EFC6146|nr:MULTISPECIES: hypothetical protein [unclassified Lactobacillus]RMC41882.1 hypothetical protein F5ESL0237_00895 [Lactobacillus sp. ESL0237]RMC45272.1 hypothetical protein F5ESL0234_00895 [Lactobacillus sp. ESL0234]RMC46873.1 hypothetical protein F5ESL0236_00900 [Lactobacillus sp. ESL0236]RMC47171.1 hypothetical protein F5ESL0230_01010 [Lactobacillus sp. ESL0230]RMC51833.1 hypothetical protein F5ESL0225_00895 [Lactobacillus sp. ESL0225]
MNEIPEDKSVEVSTDYENQSINMRFSENLTDDRERGYILSAAFFSFCASQGLSKSEIIDMVSSYYDEFLKNNA